MVERHLSLFSCFYLKKGIFKSKRQPDAETALDRPHPCGEDSSHPAPPAEEGAFAGNDSKCLCSTVNWEEPFPYSPFVVSTFNQTLPAKA